MGRFRLASFSPALQAMQEIGGFLRMGRGGKNRPFVVLQGLQPSGDVGGVVIPDLRRQFQIGTEKRRAEFGNKLLHRVPCIAEALAAEITGKARVVLRPVDVMPISA